MVLGSPGKIVRQLSDEDVARFGGAAGRYVKNWKRFAAGLQAAGVMRLRLIALLGALVLKAAG